MKNPDFERILAECSQEATDELTSFVETIDSLTEVDDVNQYLTVDQLEKEWERLNSKTKKIYSEAVSRLLANANEKKLIELKKANSKKEG